MKKYFITMALLVVLFVAFAALGTGSVTSARADTSTGMTCGGRVDIINAIWQNNEYEAFFQHYCGDGKSYMWELQHNTSAHPQQWTDFSDSPSNDHKWVTSASGCNNGCSKTVIDGNTTQHCSSNWPVVRVHVWWQDGDTTQVFLNYC